VRNSSRRNRRRFLALTAAVVGIAPAARALVIVPDFSSSITSLSNAGQVEGAVNYAITQYEELYSNPITVTLTFQATTAADYLASTYYAASTLSYTTVRSAFDANASSSGNADQLSAAADNWPATDPYGSGGKLYVLYAEQQALGLMSADDKENDATIVFNVAATISYSFDPYDRGPAGYLDFIGAAEHEIAHAMGRVAGLGGTGGYYPLDLYRFIAPETLSQTLTSDVYYSTNDGGTNLRYFAVNGDTSDWANNGPDGYIPDSYDETGIPGYTIAMTPVDITEMTDLAYNPFPTTLTWNGGNADFLTGNHWSSSGESNVNPFHGTTLVFNTGGTASHNFTSGENLTLASNYDLGTTLEVESGTFKTGVSGGVSTNGFGIAVDQDGSLITSGTGVLNIAGPLSVGDGYLVTNGTASFSGSSTVNVGTVSGTDPTLYAGNAGTGSISQSGNAVVNAPTVVLGNTNGAQGYYSLSGSAQLNVSSAEYIAGTGNGTFNQTGGTNNLTGSANLAIATGYESGLGLYYLSGGVLQTSDSATEYIGDQSDADFFHSGGTNTTGNIVLGGAYGSDGIYLLSGSGVVVSSLSETVGDLGEGAVYQSGGSNTTGDLVLGAIYDSIGKYLLSAGVANATNVYVGGNGTVAGGKGVVNVGGSGLLNVSGTLTAYSTFQTSVNLTGGTINTEALDFDGEPALFSWTSGTLVFTEGLTLDPGEGPDTTGDAFGPSLTVGTEQVLVSFGNQILGGTSSFSFTLNGSGADNVDGGNLDVGEGDSTATFTLTGNGFLMVSGNEAIGDSGTGTFIQSGGANSALNLIVGNFFNSSGTYALSGLSNLSCANETIGAGGPGLFNQSGGDNFTNMLSIGMVNGANGTYLLSGGSTYAGAVNVGGPGGTGVLTVSGAGILNVMGTLTVVNFPGTSINLSGGTINTAALDTNGMPSLFNWTSGTLGLTAGVTFDTAAGPTSTGDAFGPSLNVGPSQALVVTGNEVIGGPSMPFTLTVSGINTVSGSLNVGEGPPSVLTLAAGGNLSVAGDEYVGDAGTGILNQTGGTNAAANITIGNNVGSIGTYALSGGVVSCELNEYVGESGAATFNQTGGANTATILSIGVEGNANGTYLLSGGTLGALAIYVGGSFLGPGGGGTGVLTVNNSGQLTQPQIVQVFNAGRVNLDVPVSNFASLTITGNGIVNLNGKLNINYGSPPDDPITAIVGYLRGGYNGGAWTGTSGIISTSVPAGPGKPILSVGYADGNTDIGTPAGPNQLVVQYAMAGDANLDGHVNSADLLAVDQNFNKTGTDWAHGNFTYITSGPSTTSADLLLVVQNFNQTLPPPEGTAFTLGGTTIPLTESLPVQSNVPVPEPATAGLLAVAAAGILGRRRRRNIG
jgi:hypothetical protein